MEERPKILIVDDEPYNVDYLEQELEDLEYASISAANGQEALDLITTDSPDVILLDIMMPVMDGFEVLSRLKADETWRHIPVLVISALSDMDSIVKGIELGAEDYLPKPFDPTLLQARLKACLEKKRLRDIEQLYLLSLERELEIGREIQAGFLPEVIPQPENWEIAAYLEPAREVAGDFYDVFPLPGNNLGIVLGDVCDKGVGSALYMALFRTLLRTTSNPGLMAGGIDEQDAAFDSASCLKNAVCMVNNYICTVHNSATFATLFFGVLDPSSGSLLYINAGHEPPLILNRGKIKSELMPTGPAVGFLEGVEYNTNETRLEPKDTLFIFTDGVTDVQNSDGEMFERDRFLSLLDKPVKSPQSLVDHITSNVFAFIGETPQYDDITLLAVRRKS